MHAGDPAAHLSLAQCYSKGDGVEESFENAFKQYELAATAGMSGIINFKVLFK